MTDNKELYIEYLKSQEIPEHGKDYDRYYVIEIMRRGKDNPDLPAANVHFKNYYIDSLDKFEAVYEEIKSVCTLLRMRAYFSVNYKSCRQVLLDTIAVSATRASQHDYKKPWSIYESCSGKYASQEDKKWVVDIDNTSLSDPIVAAITDIINTKCMPSNDNKVLATIPTKSGVHLITTPFNIVSYYEECLALHHWKDEDLPEVKKNHLSLLYENL